MLPGAGRVYALIITGRSITTNRWMRSRYKDALRQVEKAKAAEAVRIARKFAASCAPLGSSTGFVTNIKACPFWGDSLI